MLFTHQDLSTFLKATVSTDEHKLIERVVAGWLAEVGLVYDQPVEGQVGEYGVPSQVFAWSLQLGAILWENPTSMSMDVTGSQTQAWGSGAVKDLMAQVRAYAVRQGLVPDGATGAVPSPLGRFPAARGWPDPVERPIRRGRPWPG